MRQCVTKEEISQIKQLTKQNLISWGFLIKRDGKYYPTNAFVLMTDNVLPQATIQCGLFKGVNRDVFIDRQEILSINWMKLMNMFFEILIWGRRLMGYIGGIFMSYQRIA